MISKFQRKGRRQLLLLATAAERERESRTTTTMKVLMVFIDTEDSSINFTLLVLRNLCFSRSKKNRTITYQKNRTWCVTVSSNFTQKQMEEEQRDPLVSLCWKSSLHTNTTSSINPHHLDTIFKILSSTRRAATSEVR